MVNQLRSLYETRVTALPSWVVMIQAFMGLGWLRAAVEKIIDPSWWTGATLGEFIDMNRPFTLAWFRPFVELVVEPFAWLVAFVVILLQLVAAYGFLSGQRLRLALGVGMLLNLTFIATGAVDPSVFYLLAQGTLALWLAERRPSVRILHRLASASIAGAVMAGLSLPLIRTIDPAEVIHDPAVMLVTVGLLAMASSALASRRVAESMTARREIPKIRDEPKTHDTSLHA